jgi:hypothetical protein
MMRRSFPLILVALVLPACANKGDEPPPPAASAMVPPAAPRATGAMAAGLESARAPAPPTPEDEPDEMDPLEPVPAPGDDGGVPL